MIKSKGKRNQENEGDMEGFVTNVLHNSAGFVVDQDDQQKEQLIQNNHK